MKDLENPYLRAALPHTEGWPPQPVPVGRVHLVRHFAYGIPDAGAVACAKAFSVGRIIEIGAGLGYWAWQFRQAGLVVTAYDSSLPAENSYFDNPTPWSAVELGDASVLADYRKQPTTLFLCWPLPEVAESALEHFTGERLIFVGIPGPPCATTAFMANLRANWSWLWAYRIPRFWHVKDIMLIYERTKR